MPGAATLRRRLIVIAVIFADLGASRSRPGSCSCRCTVTSEFVAKAERQHMRTLTRAGDARRHRRSRKSRARDGPSVDTIYAGPDRDRRSAADGGARCVRRSTAATARPGPALVDRLSKKKPFQYVKRQVSPDEAQTGPARSELDGIGFMTESHRFYPEPRI